MDATEAARQVAAELHERAVATGADPWSPYDLALREARRRDIEVELASSGAVILNGARATYSPVDRLIVHENVGTPFEQAFLVAHELGHVELGDDTAPDRAQDVDLLRPAEPSPIGLDRVIDYGHRQRREVQMDLFAREFLLPRPVARRLHLEHGLTASQIAAQLGAPIDVVAQQLLDALLLPPVVASPDEVQPDRPLNDLQMAAVKHRGVPYLLEAGPGTGKTQTLAARVGDLLKDGVDPRRILLLTFSNKAAAEMAERISRSRKDAAAAMWIGTFHAFGLDLLRRFHQELGLPADPRMLDRTEAVELLEEEFPRLRLAHYRNLVDPTQIISDMLTAVSRAKDEVVDVITYAALAQDMFNHAGTPDEQEAAERALEVAEFYGVYERLKRTANCVDFGDLVALPVHLLERNAAIRAHLQAQYDHVLVDEYQDVNRSSVRLLRALRPNGNNLWVVGDAKQSIYRFRGASSFNIVRFGVDDFPEGVRGRLKLNYRSAAEVVGAFSAFASGMAVGGTASGLVATRPTLGAPPELRLVQRAEGQPGAIKDAILDMQSAGFTLRDQAILCTGNDKLSSIGQELERLGIPVLFLGSLFERPEVKDLLSLLSLLVDGRAMGLLRIGCWPEFALSLSDVDAVLAHLRSADPGSLSWLPAGEVSGISERGRQSLATLAVALEGFGPAASPWTVLTTVLLDRTSIAAGLATSTALSDKARGIAIWQFLNFVRAQPGSGRPGLPITLLLDRIRRLVRLGDDRELRQLPAAAQSLDAVRLMTIHGAKGLEFPVVHLPGLNADTLPRTSPSPACPSPEGMLEGVTGPVLDALRAGQTEEQECLFYVALSRARDRLLLYASTEKSNGQARRLSPFVDRLGPGVSRSPLVPSDIPVVPLDTARVDLRVEGPLRFHAPQLALYETCPRRFLYTYILQIGGRRTSTAFMRLHEAVQAVMEELLARAPSVADVDLDERVARALVVQGLGEHGSRDEFQALALTMLRFLATSRQDQTPEPLATLILRLGAEEIVVRPDDVLVRPDGARTVRRIRTGHFRSDEAKDVGAAAFVLAVRQAFPDATVELLHLADGASRQVTLSAKELQNRQGKLTRFLDDIRQGHFPTDPSSRGCPKCPAFFICGPLPDGHLERKLN